MYYLETLFYVTYSILQCSDAVDSATGRALSLSATTIPKRITWSNLTCSNSGKYGLVKQKPRMFVMLCIKATKSCPLHFTNVHTFFITSYFDLNLKWLLRVKVQGRKDSTQIYIIGYIY